MSQPANARTCLSFALGAPRRAVEPALLAQRLPKLAAALSGCTVQRFELRAPAARAPSAVQVFAAQLGVQRSYVSLECLPALAEAQRLDVQARCAAWCAELGNGLIFTPASPSAQSQSMRALGELNLKCALPHAAQFVGRDIATALPKTPEAKPLRQLFNASQMAFHQMPLQASLANSVWLSQCLELNALGITYLQGGLSAWWEALPKWDAAQAQALEQTIAQRKPFELQLCGSDYELHMECAPRTSWKFWQGTTPLAAVLQLLE